MMSMHVSRRSASTRHYFRVFRDFAAIGFEERAYLLSQGFVKLFVDFFMEKGQFTPMSRLTNVGSSMVGCCGSSVVYLVACLLDVSSCVSSSFFFLARSFRFFFQYPFVSSSSPSAPSLPQGSSTYTSSTGPPPSGHLDYLLEVVYLLVCSCSTDSSDEVHPPPTILKGRVLRLGDLDCEVLFQSAVCLRTDIVGCFFLFLFFSLV
jgi:hypothetical protein